MTKTMPKLPTLNPSNTKGTVMVKGNDMIKAIDAIKDSINMANDSSREGQREIQEALKIMIQHNTTEARECPRSCAEEKKDLREQVLKMNERITRLEEEQRRFPTNGEHHDRASDDEATWKTVKNKNRKVLIAPLELENSITDFKPTNEQATDYPSSYAEITVKKRFTPKTILSQSTIQENKDQMMKKLAEEQSKEKMMPPHGNLDTDPDSIHQKTLEIFQYTKRVVGLKPITLKSAKSAVKQMEEAGHLDDTHSPQYKLGKGIQTVFNCYLKNQLRMTKEDRQELKIEQLFFSTSENPDILYVECSSTDESARIYKYAKNLPQGDRKGPQLIYYVPRSLFKRYSDVETLAWQIRTKSQGQLQTNVRQSRQDYILRQRKKGDPTPWGEIPPISLPDTIRPFEIFEREAKTTGTKPSPVEADANITIPSEIIAEMGTQILKEKSTLQPPHKRLRTDLQSTTESAEVITSMEEDNTENLGDLSNISFPESQQVTPPTQPQDIHQTTTDATKKSQVSYEHYTT